MVSKQTLGKKTLSDRFQCFECKCNRLHAESCTWLPSSDSVTRSRYMHKQNVRPALHYLHYEYMHTVTIYGSSRVLHTHLYDRSALKDNQDDTDIGLTYIRPTNG